MRPTRALVPACACLALAAASACSRDPLGMVDQPKYGPYAPNDFFDDGRAMRPILAGTVPRQRARGSAAYLTGKEHGEEVASYPVPLTRELVERGRHDFEITCAACHGYLGDGRSRVASNMALRPPPSLTDEAWKPGHVFVVAGEGFGLMPGYAAQIPVDRRWGVVAYVEALRRSRQVPIDRAPPAIRTQLGVPPEGKAP